MTIIPGAYAKLLDGIPRNAIAVVRKSMHIDHTYQYAKKNQRQLYISSPGYDSKTYCAAWCNDVSGAWYVHFKGHQHGCSLLVLGLVSGA